MKNPLLPWEAVIQEKRQETADTWTLSLAFKDPVVRESYRFLPGQFNMVGVWGVGEVPISFSSSPSELRVFHHTLRVVGTVTRELAACNVGVPLGIRGPYGNPWPMEAVAGTDLLVIAGGIGLAPLRPVIEERLANAAGTGKTTILYGARTPADLLYTSDFPRWEGHPGVRLLRTVDRANGQGWPGRTGVVTTLLDEAAPDPAATAVFLCGPEIMMRLSALELRKRGFPAERIYVSLERNMKCAVGQCGHCLYGPYFVCKNGPVFRLDALGRLFGWGM